LTGHTGQRQTGQPAWLWLNLLSLDAPLVALVWQDFLARCYPAVLQPAGRAALGLTVWAIYLADRLLDSRRHERTPRHEFYRRHYSAGRALLAAVLCADSMVAAFWLRRAVLDRGLLVTAGVIVYLGAFSAGRSGKLISKKTLAGLLFTSGTFLIASTGVVRPERTLGWPAAAFCALCLGNLLMIENWERGRETVRGWIWMALLGGVCLSARDSRWFSAVGMSAAGLGALACWGRKVSRDARCVLADAVLLAPLLFRFR
jgi:hypothetical protein